MRFLALISIVAACASLLAALLPVYSDWLLLTVPTLLASLYLLARHRPPKVIKRIVVDASNVMYWLDNTPKIDTLRDVLQALKAQGFTPGTIFDANAGYLLAGRYLDDGELARLLGLPIHNVVVVQRGTPADPMILRAARDLGAAILSNDQYRDWVSDHPEIKTPGHLIKGGYKDGALWLGLPAA
jgi:hypothetical protein